MGEVQEVLVGKPAPGGDHSVKKWSPTHDELKEITAPPWCVMHLPLIKITINLESQV